MTKHLRLGRTYRCPKIRYGIDREFHVPFELTLGLASFQLARRFRRLELVFAQYDASVGESEPKVRSTTSLGVDRLCLDGHDSNGDPWLLQWTEDAALVGSSEGFIDFKGGRKEAR